MSEKRSPGERLYRLILRLCPRELRDRYGRELVETFRVRESEVGRGRLFSLIGFWIRESAALGRAGLEIAGEALSSLWGRGSFVDGARQDIRFALRGVRRKPGFSIAAVVVLALGIGLNTAIYSVLSATLLSPLPYRDADRLVALGSTLEERGWDFAALSIPELRDVEAEVEAFEEVGVIGSAAVTLTGEGPARQIPATFATSSYFQILAADPVVGRVFGPAADDAVGAMAEVLVSEEFWLTSLGARRDIPGAQLEISAEPYTVIGVLPRDFRDLNGGSSRVDLWLPLSMGVPYFGGNMYETRANRQYLGVAKLRSGSSLESARHQLDAVARRLEEEHPVTHKGRGVAMRDLRAFFYGDLSVPIKVLFIGAVLVLLICVVNVGGLLLVRGTERWRELAVRQALGAERGRLVRQLLTEGLVLALLGGAAGIGVAALTTPALLGAFDLSLPPFVDVRINAPALFASLGITGAAGMVFAIYPALRATRTAAGGALGSRGGDGSTRPGGGRYRWGLLIATEVALGVVLTVGAGLTAKSLHRLANAGVGYRAENLITARLDLRRALEGAEERIRFVDALREEARNIPGVRSATVWGPSMLGSAHWHVATSPPGALPDDPEAHVLAQRLVVTPGGLRNIGIPLLRGREFTEADGADSPPVVVIDERLAEAFWPGQNPVGRQLPLGRNPPRLATVVGLVAEVQHRGRRTGQESVVGEVYMPYAQFPWSRPNIVLRTRGDQAAVVSELREIVARLAPSVPVSDVATMAERLRQEENTPRFTAALMMLYASVAILLALIGTYGVLAYSVRRRSREIAIRSAIGARRVELLGLVFRQGFLAAAIGIGAGLLGALGASRLLTALLFGVTAADPPVYLGTTLLVMTTAALACLLPALRAARLEPMSVLREE